MRHKLAIEINAAVERVRDLAANTQTLYNLDMFKDADLHRIELVDAMNYLNELIAKHEALIYEIEARAAANDRSNP